MSKKTKDTLFVICMLALPIANFCIFWVAVNFKSILMAFQNESYDGSIVWTLDNFKFFFNDLGSANSTILLALRNTAIFFCASLLIILPLSLFLCYFLYKNVKGYRVYRFIFYLPSIISASVFVALFKKMIATDSWLGNLITMFGGTPNNLLGEGFALQTILFYNIMFSLGGNMILLSGAMSHIPEDVIEAGKLDGVGMWREMFLLVIPLIWPTLTTLIIFDFVGIFNASGPILLFTQGAYHTTTLSYWLYEQVALAKSYYRPAAVGLVMTLIATPIAMLVRYGLNKTLETVEA